ncbi:MAG TPA: outer membrane lipoprotein-sorting protein [Sedimenticola thiotaurini]|uniref:Outer membrane lipoprotein-sorting protein n=1 Tax=Sedimenticola thiotaurini TaxID=1543721 RepID=A0A831RPZ3_9GAMM|nr:outer membrane lipoprotein-sorting protein [Sedimenticola thiotaurini]
MGRRGIGWVVLGFLGLSLVAAAAAAVELENEAGIRLARQVYDRPDGSDMSSRVLMVLKDKGGKTRKRVLYSYAKDKGPGERWTLMRFVQPADIEGTGLLTLDHPGDDSDQWLYLPALDRVRRISSSRKGGRFVGSDFFYEDLRDREVDMDHHRFAGRTKLGKLKVDLLISTPKDPANSVYSRRVSWIHPRTLIPLRVDLYTKGRSKPVKRLKARRIKKIQGYWTVLDSTMYDLRTGHSTRLLTKRIKYDQKIPDSLFIKRALSDATIERPYRP